MLRIGSTTTIQPQPASRTGQRRDDHDLRRVVVERTAIEAAEERAELKAGARHEMRELGRSEPPHLEAVDDSLRAIASADVVEQLDVAHLLGPVHGGDAHRASERATVGKWMLRRVLDL